MNAIDHLTTYRTTRRKGVLEGWEIKQEATALVQVPTSNGLDWRWQKSSYLPLIICPWQTSLIDHRQLLHQGQMYLSNLFPFCVPDGSQLLVSSGTGEETCLPDPMVGLRQKGRIKVSTRKKRKCTGPDGLVTERMKEREMSG